MKVTINLSEAEERGIVRYLKSVDVERPTKKDIKQEVIGIVNSAFNSEHSAIADYIREEENKVKQ